MSFCREIRLSPNRVQGDVEASCVLEHLMFQKKNKKEGGPRAQKWAKSLAKAFVHLFLVKTSSAWVYRRFEVTQDAQCPQIES